MQNNLGALEAEIKVSNFTKEAGKRDLDKEFSILEQVTYLKTHKERFNTDPEVQHLNRYCDILPCTVYVAHTIFSLGHESYPEEYRRHGRGRYVYQCQLCPCNQVTIIMI
jgi:hypothetical protein